MNPLAIYYTPKKTFEFGSMDYTVVYSESYFALVEFLSETGFGKQSEIDMFSITPKVSDIRSLKISVYYVYVRLMYTSEGETPEGTFAKVENSGAVLRSLDDILKGD